MRKLYMKEMVVRTSTYSSDEFGVCSALYELGGMVVMHDASGCNSTYTTHDEPRWYEQDSMIYISAISEMEAIMGDDRKFIDDLTATALSLKPAYIALVGAPIPYMTGTDFPAIARIVEEKTKIPCFGFPTNGMHYYTKGISLALEEILRRFCTEPAERPAGSIRVNLLGVTPLDFPAEGTTEALRAWLMEKGFEPGICLAMGCSLEEIRGSASAHVNLVLSYGGLAAAQLLEKRFGTPYVVGVPYGKDFSAHLARCLRAAADFGEDLVSYWEGLRIDPRSFRILSIEKEKQDTLDGSGSENKDTVCIIGESVLSSSLAAAIEEEKPGLSCRVLCPVDTETGLLRSGEGRASAGENSGVPVPRLPASGTGQTGAVGEEGIAAEMAAADLVIADPLYRVLCPEKEFIPLPHTAFSGRIFEKEATILMGRLPEGLG